MILAVQLVDYTAGEQRIDNLANYVQITFYQSTADKVKNRWEIESEPLKTNLCSEIFKVYDD